MTSLLTAHSVYLNTPAGRPLLRDLTLSIAEGERVAIVGRNGAGKTTLLRALAGTTELAAGRVTCTGARLLVTQLSDNDAHGVSSDEVGPTLVVGSPGERRRLALQQAFDAEPAFLLLDEPSVDLDDTAVTWLSGALRRHRGACLVVSHDRRILREFRDFFVVTESGCYHHAGDFDSLLEAMSSKQEFNEHKYVQQLAHHIQEEQHHVCIARARERKQNLGRARQIKRCSSRMLLNNKRGHAQVKQAKRSALQEKRIGAAREWVKSVRRALDVDLPLEMAWKFGSASRASPIADSPIAGSPIADSPIIDARLEFPRGFASGDTVLDFRMRHERWAITGPNGSGKSTLLRMLLGEHAGKAAVSRVDLGRVGYVAQNAENWAHSRSLLEVLCVDASDLPAAAAAVAAHRFPAALAERPLASLSPGERVRAALIALAVRTPCVELLVLDEPTNHLDLLGATQLEGLLRAWPGGLLVVSHDPEFLTQIGIERIVGL